MHFVNVPKRLTTERQLYFKLEENRLTNVTATMEIHHTRLQKSSKDALEVRISRYYGASGLGGYQKL